MHLLDNPIRSEDLLGRTIDIRHRFYASSSEPLSSGRLYLETLKRGDMTLLAKSLSFSLGYADNRGSLDLRTEIAKQYGPAITAEHIVVFPGAQTGMTLTFQALVHPGDHVIVVTPSYQSLEEGPKLAGAEVTRVSLSPDGGWQPDLEAVKAALKPETRFIIFNDPHNPSGALMSAATRQALADLASEHGLMIFSDEVYRLLEVDPADRTVAMAEHTPAGISLATMSKPWGAGGTGIGWVACQDLEVIEKLIQAQHIYAVCFSRSGELQAMMALRATRAIVGRNVQIIRDNLALLDTFFAANSDLFDWVRPKAGGTGFVRFRGPYGADQLAEELLDAGILVFPPSIFDCEDGLKQYFRIGFSRKTMPAALEAFADFVADNRSKWQVSS